MKKLPLATLILASIFAIALILFIGAYSKKSAFSTYSLWGGKETTIESQNIDTDNDGLKDWEEKLYKTDPLNPDTDNDGYLDGEEINSGHNPLVKGPNDKQAFYPLPLGDKYNITNKIFSDVETIIKSYIEQKDEYVRDHPEITNVGSYLAEASQGAMTEMMNRALLYNEADWLDKASAILEQMPEIFNIEISDTDINISDDNSPQAIKSYFENLLPYLKSENYVFNDKNLVLLKESLTQGNFTEIDILIAINDDEIAKLVNLPVPSQLKDIHKKVLKSSITMRNIFISLRGFEADPVKAIVAANEVKNITPVYESLSQEITDFIKSHNLDISI